MQEQSIIVGLDIGTTKVCAIVGREDELGNIDILGIGRADSEGVNRGVITNIDRTVEAIQKAIAEAEAQANVNIRSVYVGIAGDHIRSMQFRNMITLNNPDMIITEDDVNRLIENTFKIPIAPGTEIVHVLPQDYTVDNERGITKPVGFAGVRLEGNFHIVTAQTTAAKNIYRCVQKAGLEPIELVLEPIASSFAVLNDEEKEAGVCMVDIGGGTTDIAIFKDNIIKHTAVIPFGGNVVTDDIMQGCFLTKKQAEKLKREHGAALADKISHEEYISITQLTGRPEKTIMKRMLAQIIQARCEEIIEFVASEIKNAGFDRRKLIGGIVVTGGGSQLPYLKELFELTTGIDTRIGYVNEHIAKGLVSEIQHPSFATGAGLVIYGFKNNLTVNLNEIESHHQKKKNAATKSNANGFMNKIKSWFEKTLTGESNID